MDDGNEEPLLGFLFGNVDQHNRVDADYLDDVSMPVSACERPSEAQRSPNTPLPTLAQHHPPFFVPRLHRTRGTSWLAWPGFKGT